MSRKGLFIVKALPLLELKISGNAFFVDFFSYFTFRRIIYLMLCKEFLIQPHLENHTEVKLQNIAKEFQFLSLLPKIADVPSLAVLNFAALPVSEPITINCALPEMKEVTVFSQIADFAKAYESKREIPKGIVIRIGSGGLFNFSKEQITFLNHLFKERLGRSAPKSPRKVWFVESEILTPLGEEEKKKRKKIVQNFGLVNFVSRYDKVAKLNLSLARLPKQRESREVDLTKKAWFGPMIETLKNEAYVSGYKQIDISELEERLKKTRSTGTSQAVNKVRDGRGVVFECYCGCKVFNRWDGSEREVAHCPDETCDSSPRPEDIFHNCVELARKKGILLNINGEYLVGQNIPYKEAISGVELSEERAKGLIIDRKIIGQKGSYKIIESTLRWGPRIIKTQQQKVYTVLVNYWRGNGK